MEDNVVRTVEETRYDDNSGRRDAGYWSWHTRAVTYMVEGDISGIDVVKQGWRKWRYGKN